jgi:hypothetical protein
VTYLMPGFYRLHSRAGILSTEFSHGLQDFCKLVQATLYQ